MLLAPLKWTRKCMFRFLKAYQEHYLGYMANKLHWRKDTQDCESFIAAEFRLWEKKRKRGEREGEKERKYSADILGGGNHTHTKKLVFYAGCVEKEGSKADGGKKQLQHLSTRNFVITTVSSNRLSCMDIQNTSKHIRGSTCWKIMVMFTLK